MINQTIFTKKQVCRHFNISEYKLRKLIDAGIIPEPVREPHQHPFWTARQVRLAEQRIEERDAPKAFPNDDDDNSPTRIRQKRHAKKMLAKYAGVQL